MAQEGQAQPQDENNMWAHCLVMWGNLLYEYSQILAAVEADWKPALDQAVKNFRDAGCPEDDINAALRAHTQAAHLDLPPADAAQVCRPFSPSLHDSCLGKCGGR